MQADNLYHMKVILTMAMMALCTFVAAQDKPVKIVFDVTSSDESVHETAENI